MKTYMSVILTLIFIALLGIGILLYKNLEVNSKKESLTSDKKETEAIQETSASSEELVQVQNTGTKIQKKAGYVSGKLCFPSEAIPPLEVYLQNTESKEMIKHVSKLNESQYTFDEVPVGTYVAFSYVKDLYDNGGGYTAAVPCGLSTTCKDHALTEFKVIEGETTNEIDICDWYGAKLPSVK